MLSHEQELNTKQKSPGKTGAFDLVRHWQKNQRE
jgi:hypothetical protein